MRYQGSEAYNMEVVEREQLRQEPRPGARFEVVTGGGLDARARQGVSPAFVARVRAVLLAAALLVLLGVARVTLTSATVALLQENSALTEQISDAQTLGTDLRIERSVLSSNSRITRIATQNYGMVLPTDSVTVDLGSAPADGATDGSAADGAADGDAAQTTGAAGGASDMG